MRALVTEGGLGRAIRQPPSSHVARHIDATSPLLASPPRLRVDAHNGQYYSTAIREVLWEEGGRIDQQQRRGLHDRSMCQTSDEGTSSICQSHFSGSFPLADEPTCVRSLMLPRTLQVRLFMLEQSRDTNAYSIVLSQATYTPSFT